MIKPFSRKLYPLTKSKKKFLVAYGGRSASKSWFYACLTIAKCVEGKKCACVREVASSIDESMKELLHATIISLCIAGFTIKSDVITHTSGGKIFFKGLKGSSKAETRTRIKGIENVEWLWCEEAESMTTETFNILIDTFIRNKNAQLGFTFNPYASTDPVYQYFVKKPDKRFCDVVFINYNDNPNLDKEAIKYIEDLKEKDYPLWAWRYGGQIYTQMHRSLITMDEIQAAVKRKLKLVGYGDKIIGVDVARYGDDKTVMYMQQENVTLKKAVYSKQGINETMDCCKDFANYDKIRTQFIIDDTGLSGLCDFLSADGYRVIGVPFNEGTINAMWFGFKEKINYISLLPDDEELYEELAGRQYEYVKGIKKIESKKDFKTRIDRSPDSGDALLLAFYEAGGGAEVLGDVL